MSGESATDDPRHLFGRTSEAQAEQFLRTKGYRILERNLRTRLGELDLVAQDGNVLVFVEVKARTSDAFGGALSAVDHRKRAKLVKLASQYLAQRHLMDRACRFDVVLVQGRSSGGVQVEHLQSAFDAGDGERP
jgi:putative endonuclease